MAVLAPVRDQGLEMRLHRGRNAIIYEAAHDLSPFYFITTFIIGWTISLASLRFRDAELMFFLFISFHGRMDIYLLADVTCFRCVPYIANLYTLYKILRTYVLQRTGT